MSLCDYGHAAEQGPVGAAGDGAAYLGGGAGAGSAGGAGFARPVASDGQGRRGIYIVGVVAGDVKYFPVVIVAAVVGFYDQSQGAGGKAGEFVPVGIQVFIYIAVVGAGGHDGDGIVIAGGNAFLDKGI